MNGDQNENTGAGKPEEEGAEQSQEGVEGAAEQQDPPMEEEKGSNPAE